MNGYIKLYRKIKNSKYWKDSRKFSRVEAWIDILLSVDYETGSSEFSVNELANRWKWSRGKVARFLHDLTGEQQTDIKRTENGHLVTVTNWTLYQQCGQQTNTKRTRNGQKNEFLLYDKKEIKNKEYIVPFSEIVDYLNAKAGTNYRASSQETQKHIKARWNDKFTIDDFKTVIDKKVATWKDDPEMAQYLRPSTLFGTKFEQYLNELEAKPQQPQKPKPRPGETEYKTYVPGRDDTLLNWTPD